MGNEGHQLRGVIGIGNDAFTPGIGETTGGPIRQRGGDTHRGVETIFKRVGRAAAKEPVAEGGEGSDRAEGMVVVDLEIGVHFTGAQSVVFFGSGQFDPRTKIEILRPGGGIGQLVGSTGHDIAQAPLGRGIGATDIADDRGRAADGDEWCGGLEMPGVLFVVDCGGLHPYVSVIGETIVAGHVIESDFKVPQQGFRWLIGGLSEASDGKSADEHSCAKFYQ